MLSAVENHMGPGRPYFAGPTFPQLLQPVPQVQIPTGLPGAAVAMQAAEFVRPHPKRYNGGRNGLSSPRSKYPEQTGPVNLAVAGPSTSPHSPSSSMSPKEERLKPATSPKESSSSSSSTSMPQQSPQQHVEPFSPTRLPYPTSPAALSANAAAANMYQALNYSLYGRAYTPYTHLPSPHPQPPHPLARSLQPPNPFAIDAATAAAAAAYAAHGAPPPPPHFISSVPYSQSPVISQLPPNLPNGVPIPSGPPSQKPPTVVFSSSGPVPQSSNLPQAPIFTNKEQAQQGQIQQLQNKKEKNQNSVAINASNNVGFKVPSGKEGSLKHRILTRPYDKEKEKQRSPTSNGTIQVTRQILTNNNNNNILSKNFMKGSLIELANGETKRVEDMRKEDFILSAMNSPELELADSTIVRITPSSSSNQNVFITFSYDNSRSQVDMEVNQDHPFFVYGKGWSSFSPENTKQHYGLHCQGLQVGDICISLKPRTVKIEEPHQRHQRIDHRPYDMPQDFSHSNPTRARSSASPNITQPTTATVTAVCSRPVPSIMEGSSIGHFTVPSTSQAYPNHLLEMQRSSFHHMPQILEGIPSTSSSNSHQQQIRRPMSHENPTSSLHDRYSAAISGLNYSASQQDQQPIPMIVNKHLLDAVDAENEASRKRRWSAPDFGDEQDAVENERQRVALLHSKYSH